MSWQKSPTLRALFAIDPRSLAVFRIGIAILLLTDLAIRTPDLRAMYTDGGMFPRALIRLHYTGIWHWSFHFLSGRWPLQAGLFGAAAVLAVSLLVGFKTRWAVIGSWLMLASLHHRVPPILSGADTLMRMLLFWAMFLPLERVWSLDHFLLRRRSGKQTDQGQVFSMSSAAILLQMALMYLFSAIFKVNSDWLGGKALAGTLAHDFYATSLGASLLVFPRTLTVMTWVVFVVEWASPLLLFFPRNTGRVRLVVLFALAVLHIGIGLCLAVGLFSAVALTGLTLFLPPEFWNSHAVKRFNRALRIEPAMDGGTTQFQTQEHSLSYLRERLCGLAFAYVLALNINSLQSRPLSRLSPENWRPLAVGFGLRQRWGMFEDIPSKDGWYVVRAKLVNGSEVDLLRNGAEVDWHRPERPADAYPNERWHKLFREMAYHDALGYQVFRAPVAMYLLRTWNAEHTSEKQIGQLDFIYCMKSEDSSTRAPGIIREQLVAVTPEGTALPKPIR